MAEFTYNDAKNVNTGFTFFKLNRNFQFKILYKENVDPHFRSKIVDELAVELRELISMCKKKLQYTQKL